MSGYNGMATSVLEKRWNFLRMKIMDQEGALTDMEELNALRMELDRRKGIKNPAVEVNFEDYVKD